MQGANDNIGFGDTVGAHVARNVGQADELDVHGIYHFECRRPHPEHKDAHDKLQARAARLRELAGRLFLVPFLAVVGAWLARRADVLRERALALTFVAWTAEAPNLVTTVGKNDLLDKYLAGSAYTASLALGLKGTGTAAAGDTMSSHAGWNEVGGTNAPAYSGTRPVPSFSAASAGVKSTSSAASFSITSSGTVDGAFLVQGGSTTKDNTTGVLFSAGTFSGGSKTVASSDTLNVTYQLTAS